MHAHEDILQQLQRLRMNGEVKSKPGAEASQAFEAFVDEPQFCAYGATEKEAILNAVELWIKRHPKGDEEAVWALERLLHRLHGEGGHATDYQLSEPKEKRGEA